MPIENRKDSKDHNVETFVSLLTDNQARIYSYVLSMIPNFNDADDILQDTTKLMWEKFGQYKFGTDFVAWGREISYFLILEYYRKKKKINSLYYDEQLIKKLEKNTKRFSDSSKDYLFHLNSCMKKLKKQDRILLKLRYFENSKAKELAARFGCSVQYVYRKFFSYSSIAACLYRETDKVSGN